jgi:uncharacterized protein (TIGR02001 family)
MRWILSLLAALVSFGAVAQVSGTVSITSDYRFRGVSLSDNLPAAQVDLGFDHPSGWYAGLFASNVRLDYDNSAQGQALAYTGYAQRLGDGLSLDAGASYTGFSGLTGEGEYNYAELHAGFTADSFGGRLSFAPNYFGQSLRTLYAEFNGSLATADRIRFVWHAGLLQIASGPISSNRTNLDGRAGFEFALQAVRLQLARVASQGATAAYPVGADRSHGAWLATLSYSR